MPELVDRVRRVGRDVLLARAGDPNHPLYPGDHATAVDRDAETAILTAVDELFDSPTVLSEELFHRQGRPLVRNGSLRVLVDPLDGTVAYNAGLPTFAISIALEFDGTVEAGIVHQPVVDRTYVAVRGRGAFVNGVPLEREAWTSRRVAVKSTLQQKGIVGELCAALSNAGYEIEKLESSALKLCMLAEGRRAGLIKRIAQAGGHSLSWGVAAGILVCREAGVRVTDLDGRPWDSPRDSVVAGTPELQATVRHAMRRWA